MEPSVSTAGSFLTRAFCFMSFFAPSASEMVTTAGRASGIAATASEMAVKTMRSGSSPLRTPMPKTARADKQDRYAEFLSERGEAFLQRGSDLFALLQERGYAAELGAGAGGGDDPRASAVDDGGAAVRHVLAVAERQVFFMQGPGVLLDRGGLTGEGGLFALELRRLDEAQVSRHDVACLEEHDIPGNEREGRDRVVDASAYARSPTGPTSSSGQPGPSRPCIPGQSL